MQVQDEMIENEVLQIFVDCNITAGDSLPFRRLRADWPRTHLRSGDLVQGVKRLVFSGDLELEDDHEGGLFILTPKGYARAQSLPPPPKRGVSWTETVSKAFEKLTARREPVRKQRRDPYLPLGQG